MYGVREDTTDFEGSQPPPAGAALVFPEFDEMGETKLHLELRTLIYQVLKLAFADRAVIGCDQFVYWDRTNPRACVAPDAFVRLGEPNHLFGSWKVWERGGVPDVALEIISDWDARDSNWQAKFASYEQLGVRELVRFDGDYPGRMLRVWDAVGGTLVERKLSERKAKSFVLPGFWLVIEDPEFGLTLRLSHDEHGRELYPTPAEAHRAEAEAHRAEAEAYRAEAEARIRELEAELRRKP